MFFDEVVAVNQDVVYGVSIAAIGAVGSISSCGSETVQVVCFKGMFCDDLEGSALDVTG
jgi:hypothetical protein